jgi:predicted GNAT family acetyltransferase
MTDISVGDNPAQQRYEATVDGTVAGFAQYQVKDGHIVFTHTEVDPAFEGQGVGSVLARRALDDVRAKGQHEVVAMCPFIAAWIERHPDYQDLLAA